MAREPHQMPSCIIEGAKLLFPSLDFSRIHFFLDHDVRGWDTISYIDRTEIRMSKGHKSISPCDVEFMKALCHELVHALQAQGFWRLIQHRAARWTCRIVHGGAGRDEGKAGNCVEKEAYDYEDLIGNELKPPTGQRPCLCRAIEPSGPFVYSDMIPIGNPAFAAFIAGRPHLRKMSAGCSPFNCDPSGLWATILGYGSAVLATGLSIASIFSFGIVSAIGSFVGAATGSLTGIWLGVSSIGGLFGGIVGGIIGGFLGGWIGGLLGAIIDLLGRLFGGGGGSLNLMFSTDGAQTWQGKTTFERSSNPMSLAFGQLSTPTPGGPSTMADRLSVVWTGMDHNVNLMTVPQNRKIDFPLSDDCGPAVTNVGVRVHLYWQGTDHGLNCRVTSNGQTLANYSYIGQRSLSDASPAACYTGSSHVLTYIGTDKHINLLSSPNGIENWGHKFTLNETASPDSTVAVTALGNKAIMIAWTGEDDHVNVMELGMGVDGAFFFVYKNTLGERSSDEAGPALAFKFPYLYLAWTGTDGHLNLMTSDNRGRRFFGHGVFERSRKDCGPALAIHTDGTMCIGWVGTD